MREFRFSIIFAVVAALLVLGGCQQTGDRADVKNRVERSFEQAKLDNVNVDTDNENRVVRLQGEVNTEADKQRAEQLAQEAATGWTVANEIAVRPEGEVGQRMEDVESAEDKAIRANLDAEFTKSKLNESGIDYDVNNGVVTLSGNVENATQKQQAETIAKKVEHVEQVVNNIEIGDRAMLPASDEGARADSDEKKDEKKDDYKKD